MEPGCQCRVYVDHLCLVCANCLEITVLTDNFPGIKFSGGDRPGVMLWRVYRRPNKVMPIMASSGSTSNSSFWKEASGARPGRVATGPTEISFIIDMSPYEWGSKFIITISRLSSLISPSPRSWKLQTREGGQHVPSLPSQCEWRLGHRGQSSVTQTRGTV